MSTHMSTTARHEARNSRARRSTTTMNAPATITGTISPVTTTPTKGHSTWSTRRTTSGGGGMLRAPMGVSVCPRCGCQVGSPSVEAPARGRTATDEAAMRTTADAPLGIRLRTGGAAAPRAPTTARSSTGSTGRCRATPQRVALEFLGAHDDVCPASPTRSRGSPRGCAGSASGPGDSVALVMPNCPQNVIAFCAVLRLGATVVEHNPLYTAGELRLPFIDHAARVAIVWDKVVPVVEEVRVGSALEHVVAVDLTAELPLDQAPRAAAPARQGTRRSRLSSPLPQRVTRTWSRPVRVRPAAFRRAPAPARPATSPCSCTPRAPPAPRRAYR